MSQPEPKQVFQDMHKGNTGVRLVRVDTVDGDYAVCTILTAGGRPAPESTSRPELRGSGAVGQTTRISLARLLKPYRYQPVNEKS